MRTIALALIGAGFATALAAALPTPVKAESDRTIQNNGPDSYYRPDSSYDGGYGYNRYAEPGYAYAPRRTWHGCPPHYRVRHGVCVR